MFLENRNSFSFFRAQGREGAEKALPVLANRYLELGYSSSIEDLLNDQNIPHSMYFWAEDRSGNIAGSIRLILTNKKDVAQLPTLKNLIIRKEYKEAIGRLPRKSVAEVGRLAINKGNNGLSYELYRQIWLYSWNNKIGFWVISADLCLIRILEMKKTRVLFDQIGKDQKYMGSITRPGFKSLYGLVTKTNPNFRQFLYEPSQAYPKVGP